MKRLLLTVVLLASISAGGSAQGTRAWSSYSELVSIDEAAKAITLKAMVEPSFGGYLDQFEAGDDVVLIWSIDGAKGGDGQTVVLIATPEQMKIVDAGYITRAEFVLADAATKTVTFKVPVPDVVLLAAAAAQPGKWLKITAPMEQPGPGVTLTAANVTDKPAPKPPKPEPPPAAAADAGMRRDGRGQPAAGASTVKANGGISGPWRLVMDIGSNTLEGACDLAQDGTRLGGTCSLLDNNRTAVDGAVDGSRVTFSFMSRLAANNINLHYDGTLEEDGSKITGTTTVDGRDATFAAIRK